MHVLMVGPDPEGFGGMSTVVQLFLTHTPGNRGVILRHVVTHQDGSVARRVRVFGVGAARVLALLAARRVDVLHLHVSERGSLVRKGMLLRASAALGVPVVLHCHGAELAPELASLGPRTSSMVRAVFSRAAVVAVLSAEMAATVTEAGADPTLVRVVPNPVALPRAVPQRPTGAQVAVVFLGRLAQRKGATDLVHAVAEMDIAVRERLRLRMFGDGPVEEVRRLVDELGVGTSVSVRGWLAPDERDSELAQAEVFVLPSYNEGLPMALLEAMAWGVVPLVTPVGGIPAVVTDHVNGVLVTPGDTAALAAALTELVIDADLRGRLAVAARETAAGHDVRGYVREWVASWDGLSAGGSPLRGRTG